MRWADANEVAWNTKARVQTPDRCGLDVLTTLGGDDCIRLPIIDAAAFNFLGIMVSDMRIVTLALDVPRWRSPFWVAIRGPRRQRERDTQFQITEGTVGDSMSLVWLARETRQRLLAWNASNVTGSRLSSGGFA